MFLGFLWVKNCVCWLKTFASVIEEWLAVRCMKCLVVLKHLGHEIYLFARLKAAKQSCVLKKWPKYWGMCPRDINTSSASALLSALSWRNIWRSKGALFWFAMTVFTGYDWRRTHFVTITHKILTKTLTPDSTIVSFIKFLYKTRSSLLFRIHIHGPRLYYSTKKFINCLLSYKW